MGKKTFESIGRALPGRQNIVLTRQDLEIEGVEIAHTLDEAFDLVLKGRTAFIFGGAEIYRQAIDQDLIEKIYATEIEGEFKGDTFFPEIDPKKWREISREQISKDERNKYNCDYVEYERYS